MATVLVPRVLVTFAVCLPLHLLATQGLSPINLICLLLAIELLSLASLFLCLDDAFLPLALKHPDMGLAALYRRSIALTRPRIGRILLFKLSFLGDRILSILSLGVLFLAHDLPHYCLSHAAWTNNIYTIKENNTSPTRATRYKKGWLNTMENQKFYYYNAVTYKGSGVKRCQNKICLS